MTNLLSPRYPPLAFDSVSSWADSFSLSVRQAKHVQIVTGYASENSLLEIVRVLEASINETKSLTRFDFVLGMAFFDGLTDRQKVAASSLNAFLADRGLGRVYVPTGIAVHAKCSLFRSDYENIVIIGSSNFTALLPTRQSELDVRITDADDSFGPAVAYIERLIDTSQPLDRALLEAIPTVACANTKLLNSKHSKTYDSATKKLEEGGSRFHLPIKTELKSNLNKFNAAPRGRIPRSWYEVEIIVPTSIQTSEGFPSQNAGTDKFTVYTDDGFQFVCHVSGGTGPRFNKNFESSGDLKVLGYWLKGRLVASGVINEGDLLEEKCLQEYGRSFVTMSKLSGANEWFLDFGRGGE